MVPPEEDQLHLSFEEKTFENSHTYEWNIRKLQKVLNQTKWHLHSFKIPNISTHSFSFRQKSIKILTVKVSNWNFQKFVFRSSRSTKIWLWLKLFVISSQIFLNLKAILIKCLMKHCMYVKENFLFLPHYNCSFCSRRNQLDSVPKLQSQY